MLAQCDLDDSLDDVRRQVRAALGQTSIHAHVARFGAGVQQDWRAYVRACIEPALARFVRAHRETLP